jgi:Ser/Thr protein kinase RdoA (MazF antagonist)
MARDETARVAGGDPRATGEDGAGDDFYRVPPGEQVARLRRLAIAALRDWGIDGVGPELLKYRENAVFKVVGPDGRPAALRVHRQGYHSDAELASELLWMRALRADGIDVPGIVPTRAGAPFVRAVGQGVPEPRQVDMTTWLDGQPFGSLEGGFNPAITDVAGAFREVGAVMARLHAHAARWPRPDGFSRHAWDLDGLLGERPVWGRFWELASLAPAERALIDRARAAAQADLARLGQPADAFGLIHADFLIDNLLLGASGIRLLDFDDCGFGWHLFDLATVSLFFRGEPVFDLVREAVIEGYRGVRDLTDERLALMPLFYLMRALTYLGWLHTRFETPAARDLAPAITGLAFACAEDYLGTRSWKG